MENTSSYNEKTVRFKIVHDKTNNKYYFVSLSNNKEYEISQDIYEEYLKHFDELKQITFKVIK
jgi:hypothetical protein